jgi:hypothetical protein
MSEALAGLRSGVEFQIAGCEAMGSRFSATVLRSLLADIEADGPFAALDAAWAGSRREDVIAAAAPLRLLGGLHDLVLRGLTPGLASHYPQPGDPRRRAQPDLTGMASQISDAGREHRAILADFASSPPQTNEVRRSLCLVGGFLTVARETGLPLRCLEIGASAGLNVNWDRYRYELGAHGAWGDPASPVRLDSAWSGASPPFEAAAVVAQRAGCDRAPIDVSEPDQALRLEAFVWADQSDRLERLRTAIALARQRPVAIDMEDAGSWALRMAPPHRGAATVLFHSVTWSYLSTTTRAALAEAIRRAAEQARSDQPFAWLRMEPNEALPTQPMELRLTRWPGGQERGLARVQPHGAKVLWLGA